MAQDYIKFTEDGYPYNGMCPPDFNKLVNPSKGYEGYESYNRGVLFYDFAVQNYDLQFSYKGKMYYFKVGKDYVALSDETFTENLQTFDNAMDAILNFEIDGEKLIDIVDYLEDVEPV